MEKQTVTQSLASDEKIIDMYWERNPDAIQKTDHKYGSLLRNVAYNILSDYQDCEECQNDTYLKIWNTIPSTRPPTFFSYVIRIMREIAIDRFRKKSRKKRNRPHPAGDLGSSAAGGAALVLGEEVALQGGEHQQAHQRCREAAVVQAHAAVELGHGGDHAVVEHGGEEAVAPAVLVGDGAQTVGIAQTHHNGLGMKLSGKEYKQNQQTNCFLHRFLPLP